MKVFRSEIFLKPPLKSRGKANRLPTCVGLVVLWFCMNLTNSILCNNLNVEDSENNLSTTTATMYANDSVTLLKTCELCDDGSSEMVWSQFLEDYVIR